jgi:hypothetical protein
MIVSEALGSLVEEAARAARVARPELRAAAGSYLM